MRYVDYDLPLEEDLFMWLEDRRVRSLAVGFNCRMVTPGNLQDGRLFITQAVKPRPTPETFSIAAKISNVWVNSKKITGIHPTYGLSISAKNCFIWDLLRSQILCPSAWDPSSERVRLRLHVTLENKHE